MICKAMDGERSQSHDTMVHTWRQGLRRCGCSTSKEPAYAGINGRTTGRVGTRGGDGLRRGDIIAMFAGGRVVVADVRVTHAAAPAYTKADGDKANVRAHKKTGAAAEDGEKEKRRNARRITEGAGFGFWPLVTETGGLHGKAARKMGSEMGDMAAANVSKAAFVRSTYQTLSIALVRAQAEVYDASMLAVARCVGRQFQVGSNVPIQDACEPF